MLHSSSLTLDCGPASPIALSLGVNGKARLYGPQVVPPMPSLSGGLELQTTGGAAAISGVGGSGWRWR